jgi:hypothetical protein
MQNLSFDSTSRTAWKTFELSHTFLAWKSFELAAMLLSPPATWGRLVFGKIVHGKVPEVAEKPSACLSTRRQVFASQAHRDAAIERQNFRESSTR